MRRFITVECTTLSLSSFTNTYSRFITSKLQQSDKVCFNCGRSGHLEADCKTPSLPNLCATHKKGRSHNSLHESSPGVFTCVRDDCMWPRSICALHGHRRFVADMVKMAEKECVDVDVVYRCERKDPCKILAAPPPPQPEVVVAARKGNRYRFMSANKKDGTVLPPEHAWCTSHNVVRPKDTMTSMDGGTTFACKDDSLCKVPEMAMCAKHSKSRLRHHMVVNSEGNLECTGENACGIMKSRPQITCYMCKKQGHLSRECPMQKCFLCHNRGHTSQRCPDAACPAMSGRAFSKTSN